MNPSSYADLKGKSPCLILYGAVNPAMVFAIRLI
ncbi:Uncharacterised protein [Vibrio cholerae]|nr:Uncharacterised protein [Vibrio cholerae]